MSAIYLQLGRYFDRIFFFLFLARSLATFIIAHTRKHETMDKFIREIGILIFPEYVFPSNNIFFEERKKEERTKHRVIGFVRGSIRDLVFYRRIRFPTE